ncbi:Alpha/Beta hydrolase protein [Pseudomassariella vexata]|uniref:Alpha/Beta hydrolase protein n=1 Tax=Pseudomassariella vexata TaxID=1141098 RepID=A0A1Y2DFT7_9PEZI|nr:Alpha/Beta hydrolase protein [Pseudomassariella vexata]ORY58150.1 Alpha/Beta hydrolase protein [Pseudomassariella vexata]
MRSQLSSILALAAPLLSAVSAANPSVVVVPGAWQIDPTWEDFMALLTDAGYPTSKVTLPSVGISETGGLAADVDATAAILDPLLDAGKDVVLLAHSLGGLIAGNAVQGRDYATRQAAGKTGGVIQTIYLAAFMCPEGVSLFNMLGNEWFSWMNVTDSKVYASADEIIDVGFNDMTLAEAEKWASYTTWTSEKVFTDASLYSPWADNVTEAYIHTLLDGALPYAAQLQMEALLPEGSAVYNINSSHVAFLSQPDTLLSLIEDAIAVGVAAHA